MIGIYRIYHKESQLAYIGQSVNIQNRIFVHFHSQTIREGKSLLSAAMREFGKSEFGWEVLEICSEYYWSKYQWYENEMIEICSEDHLDSREAFWIDALDPIFPNGYNLRAGGRNGRMARKEREAAKYASQQLSLF